MVYPVGETAKKPQSFWESSKISGKKMFPSVSVPNCAVSRKANKNIDEGGRCHAAPAPFLL
jgi:hypothetical protein